MKKVDELACVTENLKPDIILITESWCHEEINNAYLSLDGYELQPDLRVDRSDTAQGRGGGLLVYSRYGTTVHKINKDSNIQQHRHSRWET